MSQTVTPTAGVLPMLNYINLNTPAFALPGSGGGGGGVNPAGISTNQVVTAYGTGLNLATDSQNYINIEGSKGGVINVISPGAINLAAHDIALTATSVLVNGNPIGGGIVPFQSTIGLTGPFPLTCPAGSSTPLNNNYTLTAGHTYTATFNCNYALNTGDQNNGIRIDFDGPSVGTSIGPVYSPPAFINNATTSDGAPIAASLTWTQFNTSVKGGVYITPSGTGYDCIITSVVADSDPRLVITDWGVL